MNLDDKLDRLVQRHTELGDALAREGGMGSQEFAKLSKEYAELAPMVARIAELQAANSRLNAHPCAIVAQPADPVGKPIRLADFDHRRTVSYRIRIGNGDDSRRCGWYVPLKTC